MNLAPEELRNLVELKHRSPHSVLGMHPLADGSGLVVRAFVPGFKLKVPVRTKGVVSPGEIDVSVSAGKARATAKAKFPKTGALIEEIEAIRCRLLGLRLVGTAVGIV